jgi:hypothetical protein
MIRSNVRVIIAFHGLRPSTYGARHAFGTGAIERILESGDISTRQAHKICRTEGILLKALLCEDLTGKFRRDDIPPDVISRNIGSICFERGLAPAALAKVVGVAATLIEDMKYRDKLPTTASLEKIAVSLGIAVAELTSSDRPVVCVTEHFHRNLQLFVQLEGRSLSTIAKRYGLHFKQLEYLVDGCEPTAHQAMVLSKAMQVSVRMLLMEDVTARLSKATCSPSAFNAPISSETTDQATSG